MADSAIKTEEEKKEYFDEPAVLDHKVSMLAEMVIHSQHMITFTGAGISTACGIADFRSGFNTVLDVGPGGWETLANKEKFRQMQADPKTRIKEGAKVGSTKAVPSLTHMAFVELVAQGRLKHMISQNTDGLHRKSGVDPSVLSELHGNTNLEHCMKCGAEYMRDFRVRNAQHVHEHKTGRKCDDPHCGGDLKDTIINFKENLNELILETGNQHSAHADLCIAMGSSLRVTPAANMPAEVGHHGGNLVICNLQKTPLDHLAALCIYAKCDDIMKMLMEKLGYQIPKWQKKVRLNMQLQDNGKLSLGAVDYNGAPYQMMKAIEVKAPSKAVLKFPSLQQKAQPYKYTLPEEDQSVQVKCTFQGHYKEPELTFTVEKSLLQEFQNVEVLMLYDVSVFKWEIVLLNEMNHNIISPLEFTQK